MTISRAGRFFGVLASLAFAAPLHAQGLALRAGAGAAIPVGGAGERRNIGPTAMISVEAPIRRMWSLRLDGEWSLLNGPHAPPGGEGLSDYHDLRATGASLSSVVRFSGDGVEPYLLAGIGAHRLQQVGGRASPYGTTGALQVGGGADVNIWRRVNPFVEARAIVHATDYGSADFSPTVYWPLVIGLRVR